MIVVVLVPKWFINRTSYEVCFPDCRVRALYVIHSQSPLPKYCLASTFISSFALSVALLVHSSPSLSIPSPFPPMSTLHRNYFSSQPNSDQHPSDRPPKSPKVATQTSHLGYFGASLVSKTILPPHFSRLLCRQPGGSNPILFFQTALDPPAPARCPSRKLLHLVYTTEKTPIPTFLTAFRITFPLHECPLSPSACYLSLLVFYPIPPSPFPLKGQYILLSFS